MMKTLLISTVAALFAAGAANAESFAIVDTDEDGIISMNEYQASLEEANDGVWFDMWDEDADGMLSRDEVVRGMWTHYDVTGDNTWSPDELTAWEEDQMRYQATRSGREVSGGDGSGAGGAGAAGGAGSNN